MTKTVGIWDGEFWLSNQLLMPVRMSRVAFPIGQIPGGQDRIVDHQQIFGGA